MRRSILLVVGLLVSGAPGQHSFTVSVWCFGTNVSGQTGAQRYSLEVR